MAFCGKCGTQINDGVRFCPGCGAAAEVAAAPQPVAAGAVQQPAAPSAQPVQQPDFSRPTSSRFSRMRFRN